MDTLRMIFPREGAPAIQFPDIATLLELLWELEPSPCLIFADAPTISLEDAQRLFDDGRVDLIKEAPPAYGKDRYFCKRLHAPPLRAFKSMIDPWARNQPIGNKVRFFDQEGWRVSNH